MLKADMLHEWSKAPNWPHRLVMGAYLAKYGPSLADEIIDCIKATSESYAAAKYIERCVDSELCICVDIATDCMSDEWLVANVARESK